MTAPRRLLSLASAPATGLAQRSDDELMQLARAGVESAFEQLIRRHQAALRAYCGRVCGRALGDEVAQESFLTVWRLRDSYEPRGQFRALLFTVAERRARNVLRAGARFMSATRQPEARELGASASSPLDALLTEERTRQLDCAVKQLSREQQRAIMLRYAGGLEYEEIAAILERPAATVRSRVFLGLARLRKLVRKRGEP